MHRLLPLGLLTLATSTAVASVRDDVKRPDEWFRTSAARERLANVLSHQATSGAWPKNTDTGAKPYRGDRDDLSGTFDNGATVHELRLLARAYGVTEDEAYLKAFGRGLDAVLDAQYDNGGWPQSPNARGYGRHITFNDGTMVGLMTLLREVAERDVYAFVGTGKRRLAREAFDRGVGCILKCQIEVNGVLTVWCAQHDRESLEPRGARSYEHPSLSGGESAGIVCLLASLPEPSAEIQRSIRAAVAWYERSKLTGIRLVKRDGNRHVVADPEAPPLWARFYEIETNRPIFSGRDGVIKYSFDEIEAERRNGYSWYVDSGKQALACARRR